MVRPGRRGVLHNLSAGRIQLSSCLIFDVFYSYPLPRSWDLIRPSGCASMHVCRASRCDISKHITAHYRWDISFKCHARKIAAAGERLRPDSCHAVADCHTRKRTVIKRMIPNALHAIADRHTRKPGCVAKRIIPDSCYAIRYRYACQRVAGEECIRPD